MSAISIAANNNFLMRRFSPGDFDLSLLQFLPHILVLFMMPNVYKRFTQQRTYDFLYPHFPWGLFLEVSLSAFMSIYSLTLLQILLKNRSETKIVNLMHCTDLQKL